MHIQVIVGSVREGRASMPVAQWAAEAATKRGEFSIELVDLKEWNLPMLALATPPAMGYTDALQKRWAAKVGEADGYIFVSPEYNHGYSAVLKNALDYIHAEWRRKPATFISFGNAFGARGVEQLKVVLVELQMAPLAAAVHIRSVDGKLSADGFTADEHDDKNLSRAFDELLWWTKALAVARAQS